MIRFTLETNKGPIAIIGISDANLIRMQAGMPLDIDLKSITPPGKRLNRAFIHLGHTYEQVLDDMRIGGFPITEHMIKTAKDLDEQIEREKKEV